MIPGYIPHIYDDPPEPWFWLYYEAAKGDVLRFDDVKDQPVLRMLAFIDGTRYRRRVEAEANAGAFSSMFGVRGRGRGDDDGF